MQLSLRQRLLASTLLIGAATMAAPAWAQDATPQDQPAAGPLVGQNPEVGAEGVPTNQGPQGQEIVVTGSRIARPNLENVSPVTVVNSEEVKLQGVTRTEDLLNTLPQAFAGQGGNIANGATGTSTIDLRGLGAVRTLVLVNGRRLMPGDENSSAADINFIPASLIQRVDVLTGGASAIYGADAVSGVVNFIMDTDFEGFRLDGQYSFYDHVNGTSNTIIDALNRRGFGFPGGHVADGGTIDVSATIGAGFDDGRGHVTAYATYRKINQVLQRDRDYSACALGATAAGGVNCGGSATSANGTFFTNVGTFQVGPNRTFIPGSTPFNFAPFNHYQRPDERYTLGAFADYEISEAVHPYLEVMFMDDRTDAQIAPGGNFFNTTSINCDNPLLSAQQRGIVCDPANTFVDANGVTRGVLYTARRNVEGGTRNQILQHTDFRIVGGVRGDIGDGWTYDAYYQQGRVNSQGINLGNLSGTRLTRALDVVTDPATGQPVCRSVLTGLDTACVPYDIFALGGVTQAALDYLQIPGLSTAIVQEQVASASISGDLGTYGITSPWATDGVAVVFGAEYRRESLDFQPDLALQTTLPNGSPELTGNGAATLPVSGKFNVKEGFTEVRIPIIQDSFIHELSFEGAYRYSDYSTGFTTDTYKLAAELAPTRDIRFRGGYNRAVRAPNIQELFSPQRVALDGTTDPCAGDFDPATAADPPSASQADCVFAGVSAAQYGNVRPNPAAQYNGLIGGNPNLQPEKADTYTVGAVLTPRFLPGFAATVDYFNIKIDNTIRGIGADTVLERCITTHDPFLCSLIHRDAQGTIWLTANGFVDDRQQNIGSIKTSGIDVQASYNTEIGSMGSISGSIVGTWLDKLIINNGVGPAIHCDGRFGNLCGTPSPEWRHKLRLTWTTPWGVGISGQWRYFSSVDIDDAGADPFDTHIGSQSYFDLAATFRVGDHYTFRLGAQNILDRDPPIISGDVAGPPAGSGNTYPQVYDALGRYIYAGVTLDF